MTRLRWERAAAERRRLLAAERRRFFRMVWMERGWFDFFSVTGLERRRLLAPFVLQFGVVDGLIFGNSWE